MSNLFPDLEFKCYWCDKTLAELMVEFPELSKEDIISEFTYNEQGDWFCMRDCEFDYNNR